MRIADVVTYTVQPAGVPLVVAKVVTDQPGLYAVGLPAPSRSASGRWRRRSSAI